MNMPEGTYCYAYRKGTSRCRQAVTAHAPSKGGSKALHCSNFAQTFRYARAAVPVVYFTEEGENK